MVKKLVLAGGALALLSTIGLGTPLFSYARCGVSWLRDSASDSMPLEWELKRARQMIADLKPEIEVNAKRIAREKIEVARLQEQLDETDARLVKTQSDIERLQLRLAKIEAALLTEKKKKNSSLFFLTFAQAMFQNLNRVWQHQPFWR